MRAGSVEEALILYPFFPGNFLLAACRLLVQIDEPMLVVIVLVMTY